MSAAASGVFTPDTPMGTGTVLDRVDWSEDTRVRLACVSAGLAVAFGAAAVVSFLWGRIAFMPDVGLARLVNLAGVEPNLARLVPYVLAAENLLTAAPFVLAAIAFMRFLQPPTGGPREVAVVRMRQSRILQWRVLLTGMMLMAVAFAIMTNVQPHVARLFRWTADLWAAPGRQLGRYRPEDMALVACSVVAGVFELVGLQRIARFAWFGIMPWPRSYLLVLQDTYFQGAGNRITLGDGLFARGGTISIRHERFIGADLLTQTLAQILLGLVSLRLTYVDDLNQTRSTTVRSLPNPGVVQDLVQWLNGAFRYGARPEDLTWLLAANRGASMSAVMSHMRTAAAGRRP